MLLQPPLPFPLPACFSLAGSEGPLAAMPGGLQGRRAEPARLRPCRRRPWWHGWLGGWAGRGRPRLGGQQPCTLPCFFIQSLIHPALRAHCLQAKEAKGEVEDGEEPAAPRRGREERSSGGGGSPSRGSEGERRDKDRQALGADAPGQWLGPQAAGLGAMVGPFGL